jgi:hypothetical protein
VLSERPRRGRAQSAGTAPALRSSSARTRRSAMASSWPGRAWRGRRCASVPLPPGRRRSGRQGIDVLRMRRRGISCPFQSVSMRVPKILTTSFPEILSSEIPSPARERMIDMLKCRLFDVLVIHRSPHSVTSASLSRNVRAQRADHRGRRAVSLAQVRASCRH